MGHPHRAVTLLAAVALALGGCSGETEVDVGAEGDASIEEGDDMDDVAEQAQETLDEAGVDLDAAGTARVDFMGATHTFEAAEQFGCFIVEDGGSDGAVDFDGSDADGNELYVEWAGDSTEFGRVDFTTPDGTKWTTVFGTELDVSIDGSSAEVASTMTPEVNPDEEEPLTASLACDS